MIALVLVALLQADPIGQYLTDLERQGLLPHETGSVEKIKLALAAAEDSLVARDPRTATTVLYGVVESPRFADFGDTPEFQNAETMLGRALARGGAVGSARVYLGRVLARGPRSPYFLAAYRAMIDVALESRDEKGVLGALEALPSKEPLPREADYELSYLRGKVAYERKDLSAADSAFAAVDRRSRFYAASLYFRGLVRARRGEWKLARDAFCEIV